MHSLRPAATDFSFNATPSVLLNASSSHWWTSMASLKAMWAKYLRQRMVTRLRPLSRTLGLPPHRVRDHDGNPSSPRSTLPTTVESGGATSDSGFAAGFWIDAAGERYLRVKLKLGDRNQKRSETGSQNMITASLMMDLEHFGAIEIELKMGLDQIWVDFMVASESAREKVEFRMADINAALGALATGVFCQVHIGRQVAGMHPAAVDGDQTGHPREIDLKI
jgi:flagellar hook-length control protein FliK